MIIKREDGNMRSIGLVATDEDRAELRKYLEGLDFQVVDYRLEELLTSSPARLRADVFVVSIPRAPSTAEGSARAPWEEGQLAAADVGTTWHSVIRDLQGEGAAVLVAVPDRYPALDAVFASGATEVIEGDVTADALDARLRALQARVRSWAYRAEIPQVREGRVRRGVASQNRPAFRGEGAVPPGGYLVSSESADRPLGSYSGAVHNPASGRIDAKLIASFLSIPLRRLTEALALPYGTVHKTPDSPSIQPVLRPLAQIVELLHELAVTEHEIRVWLNRPIQDLEGDSPLATILSGEAEAVEALLWNAREGVPP